MDICLANKLMLINLNFSPKSNPKDVLMVLDYLLIFIFNRWQKNHAILFIFSQVMLDCRSVHKRVVPSIDTSFRVKTQVEMNKLTIINQSDKRIMNFNQLPWTEFEWTWHLIFSSDWSNFKYTNQLELSMSKHKEK